MILHKIADKIIFYILKRISVGYLEITSISGELLKFGNYDDKLKTDLKIKSSIYILLYCLVFLVHSLIVRLMSMVSKLRG